MSASIDQFPSEGADLESPAAVDRSLHTPSPDRVAALAAWDTVAPLNLSRPVVFGLTLIGAFALGMLVVTIGMALLPTSR